jgi:hypothetical protein
MNPTNNMVQLTIATKCKQQHNQQTTWQPTNNMAVQQNNMVNQQIILCKPQQATGVQSTTWHPNRNMANNKQL